MKKKENHIWPAYVDMMTVLLLVYVLVSLLFAMMIKQDTEAKYEEKLNSLIALKVNSAVQSDGSTLQQPSGKQVSEPPPEVLAIDDHQDMLVHRDGDLILNLQPGDELLMNKEQVALTGWYQKNRSRIEAHGILLGVVTKKNNTVSIGALYRKQYMLYMDTLRYLITTEKDFKPANFIHRSPMPLEDVLEEYMVLRVPMP